RRNLASQPIIHSVDSSTAIVRFAKHLSNAGGFHHLIAGLTATMNAGNVRAPRRLPAVGQAVALVIELDGVVLVPSFTLSTRSTSPSLEVPSSSPLRSTPCRRQYLADSR